MHFIKAHDQAGPVHARALSFAVYASDGDGDGKLADWKLIWDVDGRRAELYDLAKDPREARDVSAAEPDVTLRLTRFLTAWRSLHYRRFLARDVPANP